MILQKKYSSCWGDRVVENELVFSEYYCPGCGKKGVNEVKGVIDADLGQQYFCLNCNKIFYFEGMWTHDNLKVIESKQIL